ncbi:MAG: ChbG/HpnK family deacetylase [Alphaproteobacteria bacterium]|nr:ChbG/HpnK family deacetylase [Alphaproteobacteria bacterium]
MKKIINADDFGMSHGINTAVVQGYREGVLNSASLNVNQNHSADAAEIAGMLPDLAVGLQIDLTHGACVSDPRAIPLLAGANGRFRGGFIGLLLTSLISPAAFVQQVQTEITAQIRRAQQWNLTLTHIDSRRHVHMIPAVFRVVQKLAQQHGIRRIRVVNEALLNTAWQSKGVSFLWNGGLVKWAVLRACAYVNNHPTDTYFYSVLYDGRLFPERIRNVRVPAHYKAVEFAMHPNIVGIDLDRMNDLADMDIIAPRREKEMEAILNRRLWRADD